MSTHSPAVLLPLAALFVGLAEPGMAQIRLEQRRLQAATSLSCTFSAMATATWENAGPSAELEAVEFEVTFTNINTDEGTADAGSDYGDAFIVVRYANDYLHLMQMRNGPLYTTTVMARETENGRLMAVHTRHEYTDVRLPGFTSRPEMYIGDCALGDR